MKGGKKEREPQNLRRGGGEVQWSGNKRAMGGWWQAEEWKVRDSDSTHTHTERKSLMKYHVRAPSQATSPSTRGNEQTDRMNAYSLDCMQEKERKIVELLPSFSRSYQIRTLSKCKYTTLIIICNKTVCIDLQRWKNEMHAHINHTGFNTFPLLAENNYHRPNVHKNHELQTSKKKQQ